MNKSNISISKKFLTYVTQKKILIIFFIFIFSILIRPHFFTNTLINTEWNTSTVLRHLVIWDQEGAMRYNFNPVITFPVGANRYIDNHASTEEGFSIYSDKNENYYYTSYPQFGYIAPYLFFKLFFLRPSVFGMHVFQIIIQLATALCIYKILIQITKREYAGIIGYTVYMLLPITQYYYVYNYMSDMLVPLFIASTTYLYLKLNTTKKSYIYMIAFVLSMFLMIYTEYIGVLFAGVLFLHLILFDRNNPLFAFIISTCITVPIITILFVIIQFSLSGNFFDFISVMIERYTGGYTPAQNIDSVHAIWNGYIKWYLPSILTMLIVYILVLSDGITYIKNKNILTTLVLTGIPVLMHHILFLHWTGYHAVYFSTLKSGIFISIILAILIFKYIENNNANIIKNNLIRWIVFFYILFSIGSYFIVNKKEMFLNEYCEVGKMISQNSNAQEVIFVKDSARETHQFPISPVIVFCANRNIAIYETKEKSINLIENNNAKKGKIFTLTYLSTGGVAITNIEEFVINTK